MYGVLASLPCIPGHDGAETPASDDTHRRLPNETEWIKRTYPHYAFDKEAYAGMMLEARRHRSAAKTHGLGPWSPVGPTNIPGRISDIEFNPVNPDVVYAASATGGVFKSTDSGASWAPVFDDVPVQTIGDIAVDASNPETVYVGTGEANGGHNNFPGAGLYKSTDAGATWGLSGLEETVSIGRVLVDPGNPDRVYVAAIGSYFTPDPNRGVYRSTDGGASWEQVLAVNDSTGVVDLVMHPDSSAILFAAAWERVRRPSGANLSGKASGIYRSDDGGDSWQRLGPETGLPAPDPYVGRIGIAICRDVPERMYALYLTAFSYYGFYRSDDGGRSWTDGDPDRGIESGVSDFSWYFGQVRVAPDNPDVVYAMDLMFMKSTDGGANWTRTAGTHVDYHALAFHPSDANVLLAGNDGGIARSSTGGATWQAVRPLANTQFYEIGLHPTDPAQFYGGTQDNGTLASAGPDGWRRILGGDGFYVIVDPVDPSVIYAEIQFGGLVRISSEGTRSVVPEESEPDERNWSTPVAMDPNNHQVLYYGTNRIYRTEDAAESWERVSDVLVREPPEELLGTVSVIAVAPTDSDIIYAGTDDGNLWVSRDYAATWSLVSDPLPRRWITRVVIDPIDSRTAYVTYSGLRWREPQPHVFRTRDLGETWENITANLPEAPVNAFAVDPVNASRIFAGTDVGAFVSKNAGESWEALADGMPAVSVYDMKIFYDGTSHLLVAGTHGRSMYTLDLSAVDLATRGDREIPAGAVLEAPYPNPFTDEVTLAYRLPVAGTVKIEIFDVLGRRLETLLHTRRHPGSFSTTWRPAAMAPGMYFARLAFDAAGHTSVQSVALQLR